MMRPIFAAIVGITIVYAGMHFFVLPESPDVTRIENTTHLESPAYRPAALDLWEIAVEGTGVENESAVLRRLEVDLAGDGVVQVIWLFFHGVGDGEQHAYEAMLEFSSDTNHGDASHDNARRIYLCGVEGAEREDPLRKLGDGSGAPSFCFTFTLHGSSL